jgi:hypothetical protein
MTTLDGKIDAVVVDDYDYEAALSRALDLLERHQWHGEVFALHACIECHFYRYAGHKPDCELALLLRENGREVRFAEPQPDKAHVHSYACIGDMSWPDCLRPDEETT